jgi:hypothetical protein
LPVGLLDGILPEVSQRLFKTSESVVLDPGQGLGVTHTPGPIPQGPYPRAYIPGY